MLFRQIFDDRLAQYAYLVGCQQTGEALLIDPERDVDRYLVIAEEEGLRVVAVAETHIHADFLSGARQLAQRGVRVYLSAEGGHDWSYRWPGQGEYDVVLLRDGDSFRVGKVEVVAVHTPGHTPEHLSFTITDRGGGADEPMGMVSGDFVFVGDTGRPDLLESAAGVEGAMQEGAASLYRSVQRFLELPDYLQVWPGHGAGSACGKALGSVPESTVGYERRFSPALGAARNGERSFVDYILDGQPEPPMYFGRMKTLNRDGPPLLEALPTPRPLTAGELEGLGGRDGVAIVDAREGRSGFMAGHLARSLFAPFDSTFPTVTGSYVDPEDDLVLVIDRHDVEAAVRALVRIGLDRVTGFVTPHTLEAYGTDGRELARIPEIDVSELDGRRREDSAAVLDVRSLSEYRAGHVPGALHAAHTRLGERLDELPRGRPLLVHCASGERSAVAAAYLVRHGFDAVYVNGSLARWLSAHGGGQRGLPSGSADVTGAGAAG
ncbi:MAG: rhodanese-like domain-containing protein [Gemmatimonadota bacterium]|jgi:hydroxyacylglutathione hydrolase